MAVDLPGNHRSLNARQNLLRFGQGQTQVRDIAKTFRPADLYQVGAQAAVIIAGRNQPQHPSHPRSPSRPSTRPIVPPRGVIPPFSGHSPHGVGRPLHRRACSKPASLSWHPLSNCPVRNAERRAGDRPQSGRSAQPGIRHCAALDRRWFHSGRTTHAGAPWEIRITDDLLSRFVENTPPGFIPMFEATKQLGVSRQTILQRVKRGELEAVIEELRQIQIHHHPKAPFQVSGRFGYRRVCTAVRAKTVTAGDGRWVRRSAPEPGARPAEPPWSITFGMPSPRSPPPGLGIQTRRMSPGR